LPFFNTVEDAMSRRPVPPSQQQDDPSNISEERAAADLPPEPDLPRVSSRPAVRLKTTLKDRVQAGTAHFEFGALLQGVSTRETLTTGTNANDGAELVWIPAGEYMMGSEDGELRERPVHRVVLDGYWIYKTPVTVAQFRKFYADTGRTLRTRPPWGWHDEHPMVNVTAEYAAAYACWAGAALPTEAEWEFAARGTDARIYPWGNEWDPERCCNSVVVRRPGVAPVGAYPLGANPRGIMDMAGNVWEWTADWYEQTYYSFAPERNPTGPDRGSYRVLRGGSWGNELPHDYRATTRVACEPGARGGSIGFRCVVRIDRVD
jgi:formylglycine-generating enzyme required for sulfatase activity